jgi:hypothetical protein
MKCIMSVVAAAAAASLVSGFALAGPVSVDGTIGAEWAGASVKSALFNAAAPTSNFGAPTNENHQVAYDIYTRGDGDYVYVGLQSSGSTGTLDFANLYFDTNPAAGDGSDMGFEVTNERAFVAGGAGYYDYTPAGQDIHFALSSGATSTLEFAVPVSFFTSDPLAMGNPLSTDKVQLRLSQTFGYSVVGGASYGADRLGVVSLSTAPVPLPAAAWAGMALLGSLAGKKGLKKLRTQEAD